MVRAADSSTVGWGFNPSAPTMISTIFLHLFCQTISAPAPAGHPTPLHSSGHWSFSEWGPHCTQFVVAGVADVIVTGSWKLWLSLPEVAVIVRFTVPTGEPEYTGGLGLLPLLHPDSMPAETTAASISSGSSIRETRLRLGRIRKKMPASCAAPATADQRSRGEFRRADAE